MFTIYNGRMSPGFVNSTHYIDSLSSTCIEAKVSIDRVHKFLLSSEIDPTAITIEDHRLPFPSQDAADKYALLVKDASYSWHRDSAPVISDINFALKK